MGRRFRLAIIFAAEWRGGMLRNALLLAQLYASRNWEGIGQVDVVIGLPDHPSYDFPALRHACREMGEGIAIRPFTWRALPADWARLAFPAAVVPPGVAAVHVPDDGGHGFRDADAWIFFSSHGAGPVPWLRPTAVFCADLLPRRVGAVLDGIDPAGERAMLAETMIGWRRARCVFATTPTTLADVISYAGVHPDRAVLVPLQADAMPADPEAVPASRATAPGIFWVTNGSPHKNHAGAIAALRAYVAAGGTLDVTVCGVDAALLDPRGGSTHPAALAFARAPEVLARTRFVNEPPDATFRRMMAAHGLVWHNVLADNGTFTAFDAARVGAHLVSSDYPPMRYLCERHGIAALFHPARDAEAGARALLQAEHRLRQGEAPGHRLRLTAEDELVQAYGGILARIAGHG